MDSFEARALQLAFDLTTKNTYEGRVGQGYNEARAQDIRRVYNILNGRAPEDNGQVVKIASPRKRKSDVE